MPSNISYTIKVAEPCHENWNNMDDHEKGKFCHSCKKTVSDFSNKSNEEIISTLIGNKNGSVCGRFKPEQLNRPLTVPEPTSSSLTRLSTLHQFGIALFFVFGSFLFSCKDHQNKVVELTEQNPGERTDRISSGSFTTGVIVVTAGEETNPIENTVEDEVMGEGIVIPHDTVELAKPEVGLKPLRDSTNAVLLDEVTITSYYPEQTLHTMGAVSMVEVTCNTLSMNTIDSLPLPKEEKSDTLPQPVKNSLSLSPNPSDGNFRLDYELGKQSLVTIDIYNLEGKLMETLVQQNMQYATAYRIPMSLSHYPSGTYIVRFHNGEQFFSQQFMIQH